MVTSEASTTVTTPALSTNFIEGRIIQISSNSLCASVTTNNNNKKPSKEKHMPNAHTEYSTIIH